MNKIDLEKTFERNRNRFIDEWKHLLSFPSISADPAHDKDCLDCANWLVDHLHKIGFEARLLETPSKPVVFAQRKGNVDRPIILFYGHYDVQPVDPLEEWLSPPFEPTTKDDRLYARGAEDNKGQIFYAIKAMETLIRQNALDSTVKVILEGEEESGSKGISESLPHWQDLVRADILMVTDVGTISSGAPTIIMGLRGIIHLSVALTGPHYDLHSGSHGGVAPNPAQEMTRLIASLHNPDGSIAVNGFYDSVEEPTQRERRLANAIQFDMNSYKAQTGVPATAGEKQFTTAERLGFRPSIDINGIHARYGGAGMKTIIPAKATAKITARLVKGQDPEFCLNAIVNHFKKHSPEGLHLEVPEKGIGGSGFRLSIDSHLVAKAQKVLDQLTNQKTSFMWGGASIPIVSRLSHASGAEPLLSGFGMEEDKIHAPNESFSINQFRLGYLYVGLMLTGIVDG